MGIDCGMGRYSFSRALAAGANLGVTVNRECDGNSKMTPENSESSSHGIDPRQDVPDVKADLIEVAFESVFDSVSTLFRESGSILHQIIGLEFRSGRAHDAHIEVVKAPERVPVLIERMQRKWGTVAHVRLAANLPDNIPGLPHPERRSLAVIEIYAAQSVASAYCRINRVVPEMRRGTLVRKDAAG